MSLLDGGRLYDPVTVYPQEVSTDEDGNVFIGPSATGIPSQARFQPLMQSGTSARLMQSDNEGFETQEVYSMRFPRGTFDNLGPKSLIEWGTQANGDPQRWAVFGFPERRNNSPATGHVSYKIKRH